MRSFSEIETISKRASRGAGFSWGVSEEIGKSVRLLEMFGLPGILHLKNYLEKINNHNYQKITIISPENFIDVLRGSNSLGSLLDSLGYKSVPSINDPSTNGTHYYSGGYNTLTHGSAIDGSPISSIQLELPKPGIRENSLQRKNYSESLVMTLIKYFKVHYNIDL